MDVVLASIAALSLLLAVAMGAILFKVFRDEQRRSDARVALLAQASARFEVAPASEEPVVPAPSSLISSADDLFRSPEAPSAWGRRAAVAAALAAFVAIAGYILLPARSATGAPGAAAAAASQNLPLELLALRHNQDGNGLTISGLVHNPRGGAPMSQVFVTAILFAPDGSFITSGRAAVDFTALAPGDESPFVLTVPVTTTVARYRVGFRSANGSVIAHTDRRADGTSAQNVQSSGNTPWAH